MRRMATLKIRRAVVHQERGSELTHGYQDCCRHPHTIILSPSTAELLRERQKSAVTEWIFPDPLRPEQPTRPALPITG